VKKVGFICSDPLTAASYLNAIYDRAYSTSDAKLVPVDVQVRVMGPEYYDLVKNGDRDNVRSMLKNTVEGFACNGCDYVAVEFDMHAAMHSDLSVVFEGGDSSRVRFVHIGDCIGKECKKIGAKRIILLGGNDKSMKKYISRKYNIEVMGTRKFFRENTIFNGTISNALQYGTVKPESEASVRYFLCSLTSGSWTHDYRPDAIVFGSPELSMFLWQDDVNGVPVIDAIRLHADELARLMLE
jgi:aspartate/glutamate racemase